MSSERKANAADWNLLKRLWPFLAPDWKVLVFVLVVTPATTVTALLQPYLLKMAIDEHIVPKVADGLWNVVLLYIGVVLGGYLVIAAYTTALGWMGQRTIVRLRTALYDHSLRLPLSFFDSQPAGKLLTRITSDVESLGETLAAGTVTVFRDLLLIVGTLVVMFWLDPWLTTWMLLLAPLLLLSVEVIRRRLRKIFLDVREALSTVNAYLAERVDGVEVVQLYRNEQMSLQQFDERNSHFRDLTKRSNTFESMMYSIVDGSAGIFVAVILAYGGGLVGALAMHMGLVDSEAVSTGLSIGLLVAFIDYLDKLFRPLRELSGKVAIIQRAVAALSKIFWLFDVQQGETGCGATVSDLDGHLVIRDLSFRYRPDGPLVLKNINLEVQPGEVVALVGATGSGKTTLTRLIVRAYEGYSGSIQLDGYEVGEIDPWCLRREVAAVRQEIQVFSESVAFNIGLGNPDITDEHVEASAKIVHADRILTRLGMQHVLRERGVDLSVGEGQLLTFARTMAHQPNFVILDEATASVDSLTEAVVQDAIARILARKTVMVIAHRMSTIQHADKIVVMDRGEVVEHGDHVTLMKANGLYAQLVEAGKRQEQLAIV